jgi:pimeloyl-ACP methyl ester carboxylesterase
MQLPNSGQMGRWADSSKGHCIVAGNGATDQLTVRAADGRSLEVLVAGPADGLPLVFHHGTPGGVAVYPPMAAAAAARGLRLVIYGRPGYGNSTPAPGRLVADAAADAAAILDELAAPRFVTAGWSGGGPHALACARLLPHRCMAAASLAGPAPYPATGLNWLAGMAEENVGEFGAAMSSEPELTAMLDSAAPLLQDITADRLAEGMGDLTSPADKDAMRGELAEYIASSFRAGLAHGIAGWRDDDLAFVRDWGFSPIAPGDAAPVAIWQGDQDRMVPFAHGEWLARRIPAARAHLIAGIGHLCMQFDAIFDDLLELAGAR